MALWLQLEGLHNARDVGDLPVRGGGRTRKRVLLRSDEPVDCSPADVNHLVEEIGLRCVIDVRGEADHALGFPQPLLEAGVEHLALDLTDVGATPEEEEQARRLATGDNEDEALRWMTDRYLNRLGASGPRLIEMLGRLVEDRTPALVHCVAGKDRTGVAVAMLLGAADVEPSAIVADYAITEERMERVMGAIRARRKLAEGAGRPSVMVRAPAEVMHGFLAAVEENHGGVRQWFLDSGADPDTLDEWADRLVDRSAV